MNDSAEAGAHASRPFGPVHAFVFLGALLLFSLEPMVGRLLLPRFGGAFHVWSTSLMFFQGALFVAYLYAHLVAGRVGGWHFAVLASALVVLPVSVEWSPLESGGVLSILAVLVARVALPFTALATTAVVAQRWWVSRGGGAQQRSSGQADRAFALYSVSNAGSLVALLAYALLIEPFVALRHQRWAWSVGFVLYLLLGVWAYRSLKPRGADGGERSDADTDTSTGDEAPSARAMLYWAALSAAPSAFLMAVTNLIALEVGNLPLVWIAPLAIYLASFVVAFAAPRPGDPGGSRVPGFVLRLWPHFGAVGLFFFSGGDSGLEWTDGLVHLVVLAFVTFAAHAELHRVRPAPAHLTRFYLVIALGGWVGGAFVALLAPAAFSGLWEYPIALVALGLTVAIARRADLIAWAKRSRLAVAFSAALVLVIVGKIGWAQRVADPSAIVEERRSVYGLYRVTREGDGPGAMKNLISGSTRHGRQLGDDLLPLSYYHPHGPLGDALRALPGDGPNRFGVVGLGVGAAAGLLAEGDSIRFYEIDPLVVELAERHFSYLSGSAAEVEVVTGDARLSLAEEERSGEPGYDLLLVDAFAGDAIPTHLLTIEAMRLYVARLAPGGLLVLHISNRYFDLGPVLAAAARELGLPGAQVLRNERLSPGQDPSRYAAIGPVELLLERDGWLPLEAPDRPALERAWTDERVNPYEALLFP